MSKQRIVKVNVNDVKTTYLKFLLEYKKNLLLYGNGNIVFHDEDGYDLVNMSITDKRRKNFKNRDFEIKEKNGINSRKQVSQIIDFDKFYFMMKDDVNSTLLAFRENNESFVISDVLVPKDVKSRYMTRDDLTKYLSKDNQLIKYDGVWTKQVEIPSEKDILTSFKNYIVDKYISEEADEEKRRILSSLVNNSTIESVSKGFVFMEKDFLLINDDNNMSIFYVTVKYQGNDWFRVDSKYIPLNRNNLLKLRDTVHHDNTHEGIKIEVLPDKLKKIKTRVN